MRHTRQMRQGSEADRLAHALADAYRCPDCDADATLTRDALGIWHLTVAHDGTCPTHRTATR